MSDGPPATSDRPRIKKWLVFAVKLAIFVLVVWGLWRSVAGARDEFAKHEFSWTDVHAWRLLLAGGVYLLGTLPMGLFWIATLRALGQQPTIGRAIRAFLVGHLGKYVPGKAMVVILRTGLIRGPQVNATVAAVCVFIETLTMMAVGAFLAALILLTFFAEQWLLILAAIGLMICSGIPTLPPVFRRIVYVLRVRRLHPEIGRLLNGLTFRLVAKGWAANLIGWTLLAASFWLTLWALPGTESSLANPGLVLPLVMATVCLAMVAGFLSLLPGGVGVRELVIMTLVAPCFGPVTAIVSAVLLRLVWLVAELVAAVVLYLGGLVLDRQQEQTDAVSTDEPMASTSNTRNVAANGGNMQ